MNAIIIFSGVKPNTVGNPVKIIINVKRTHEWAADTSINSIIINDYSAYLEKLEPSLSKAKQQLGNTNIWCFFCFRKLLFRNIFSLNVALTMIELVSHQSNIQLHLLHKFWLITPIVRIPGQLSLKQSIKWPSRKVWNNTSRRLNSNRHWKWEYIWLN